MPVFGGLFRKLEDEHSYLRILHTIMEARLGLGSERLKLIAATEHAEVYEIVHPSQYATPLVVKTPPFGQLVASVKVV